GGAAAPPPSSSFQRPAPCHVPLSPRKRGRHVASETPRYPCPFRHSVHPNAAANSRCTARHLFASSRASPVAIPQTAFAVTTPNPTRLPASTARSQGDGGAPRDSQSSTAIPSSGPPSSRNSATSSAGDRKSTRLNSSHVKI